MNSPTELLRQARAELLGCERYGAGTWPELISAIDAHLNAPQPAQVPALSDERIDAAALAWGDNDNPLKTTAFTKQRFRACVRALLAQPVPQAVEGGALADLIEAAKFYAKVKAASDAGEDTTSNGAFRDALTWLREASCKVAALSNASTGQP